MQMVTQFVRAMRSGMLCKIHKKNEQPEIERVRREVKDREIPTMDSGCHRDLAHRGTLRTGIRDDGTRDA